ncbi:hypothetical protein ACFYPC_23855 [Streptomyces sp. NPDC005808]|uniref:hypothetical protein n=1 Tax=Streptomyces sp. NPDC005808 TaxID=3364734 RepID=UPI0036BEFFB3
MLALCWLAVFFDGMDVNISGALTAGNITDWLGRRPVLACSVTLFSLGSGLVPWPGQPLCSAPGGSSPDWGSAASCRCAWPW